MHKHNKQNKITAKYQEITFKTASFLLISILLLNGCSSESTKEANMIFQKAEPKPHVVCRALAGQLVKAGKPLANTKIKRTLSWNGNEEGQVDYFTTDENGYFSIPEHVEELALSFMVQYAGHSNIEAEVDGELIAVWYESILDEQPSPIENIDNMQCDINKDLDRIFHGRGLLGSICTWQNMPEDNPYAE